MIALLLHPTAQLSWSNFTVHPSTALGIAAIGAVYAWRVRQGPSALDRVPVTVSDHVPATPGQLAAAAAPQGPTAGQRVCFFASLLLLFLTLNGPLHDLSDFYLFSGHMVQHLILTLIVPPLMILGTPGWMVRPLLRIPALFAFARRSTTIGACFAIFNVVLAFWHLPPLYNLALANHPIHIVQHAPYPAQMLYCFLMVIPMSVISIYIAMADTLLYPAYAVAPRLLGITPMMDQQYGGLIMWIPGGVFFYAVMTVVFFKWSQRGEDHQDSAQVDWVPTPEALT